MFGEMPGASQDFAQNTRSKNHGTSELKIVEADGEEPFANMKREQREYAVRIASVRLHAHTSHQLRKEL